MAKTTKIKNPVLISSVKARCMRCKVQVKVSRKSNKTELILRPNGSYQVKGVHKTNDAGEKCGTKLSTFTGAKNVKEA
jgi:hypothetical protein